MPELFKEWTVCFKFVVCYSTFYANIVGNAKCFFVAGNVFFTIWKMKIYLLDKPHTIINYSRTNICD